MSDDKKPSRFEELMLFMGQTKRFPIDLQPINPAAPMKKEKTTDRDGDR